MTMVEAVHDVCGKDFTDFSSESLEEAKTAAIEVLEKLDGSKESFRKVVEWFLLKYHTCTHYHISLICRAWVCQFACPAESACGSLL